MKLKNENLSLRTLLANLRAQKAQAAATPPPGSKKGEEPQKPIPPGARTHTVTPGETLASIALKYYKSKARYREIQEANFYTTQRHAEDPAGHAADHSVSGSGFALKFVHRTGTQPALLSAPMSTADPAFFDRTLETMLTTGGRGTSDLMFVVGQPPQVEINGVLTPIEIPGPHADAAAAAHRRLWRNPRGE